MRRLKALFHAYPSFPLFCPVHRAAGCRGREWKSEDNLVFVNAKGGHLIDNTVLKHFKKIVTKIGIPETRFHDLRHTYATNAIRIGDPIKTVSENLGHATVAFTLDKYGHVTPAMKQDSAERMQRLIDSCC